MHLARAGQQKFLCLRVTSERQRGIFFQNFVDRDADLLFVLARLWFDRECDRGFGILNRIVNDRMRFVAERVAGLCLFQLNAGNDVAGVGFGNLVELLALNRMQRAQTFGCSSRRVVNVRISANFAADDFHHVDAAGKRIGNRAKTVGRERFAGRIFSRLRLAFFIFSVLGFMNRRVRSKLDDVVEQS